MTPRRAKCVVCMERPAKTPWLPEDLLCLECGDALPELDGLDPVLIEWAAKRARFYAGKRATKAAHAEAMRNVYQHYKGGEYRLLMHHVRLERHRGAANHDEVKMVVYVQCKTGIVWVRPLSEWEGLVKWPDGVLRPRFRVVLPTRQKKPTKEKPC